MTATNHVLDKVAEIVRTELPKRLLPGESNIVAVQPRGFVGSDGEDFIDVNVILTDDCPELDIPKVVEFMGAAREMFKEAGIEALVAVSYSRSSEFAQ